jgi:hypothetical protein
MKKSLFAVALMAALPLAQAANTLASWDINGSAQLINTKDTIRLVSAANQVGTAWAPGTLDLSGFTSADSLTVTFDFRATSGGDALSLILTSGGAQSQSPTGAFGLTGVDDGMMLALKPGVHAGGSVTLPALVSDVQTTVAGFEDDPDNPDNPGMLVNPYSTDEPRHATFSISHDVHGWQYVLSVQDPGGTFQFPVVAVSATSSLGQTLADLHHVNIGFSGSTLASAATFDILNVQIVGAPLTPLSTVPEPSSYMLALAGVAVAAWSLRRKT